MDDRNLKILEEYKAGQTLEQIAESYRVTRSRIQQIVITEIKKDILTTLNIDRRLSVEEKEMLKVAAQEEIEKIVTERKKREFLMEKSRLTVKIKEDPSLQNLSNFVSVGSYAKALGTTVMVLNSFFPEIVEEINKQKKLRWSWKYEKCITCGTSSVPHKNKGYCELCYTKSDHFKRIVKASFQRHKEARSKKMQEYSEIYKNRPEVKERQRKKNNEINFGGNREKALERDSYVCTHCGITQEESYKKYKRDLYVEHKEGKSNELNNLITVCKVCHSEKVLKKAREIGNETLLQKYARLYKQD